MSEKRWVEPVDEREFIKGITTSSVSFSGRRDYLGLSISSLDPNNKKQHYNVRVMESEGRRCIVFIKQHQQHGSILRKVVLNDKQRVASFSATIFHFLKGGSLCDTLRKQLPVFLSASSVAAVSLHTRPRQSRVTSSTQATKNRQ